jgi:hypothetical protein
MAQRPTNASTLLGALAWTPLPRPNLPHKPSPHTYASAPCTTAALLFLPADRLVIGACSNSSTAVGCVTTGWGPSMPHWCSVLRPLRQQRRACGHQGRNTRAGGLHTQKNSTGTQSDIQRWQEWHTVWRFCWCSIWKEVSSCAQAKPCHGSVTFTAGTRCCLQVCVAASGWLRTAGKQALVELYRVHYHPDLSQTIHCTRASENATISTACVKVTSCWLLVLLTSSAQTPCGHAGVAARLVQEGRGPVPWHHRVPKDH